MKKVIYGILIALIMTACSQSDQKDFSSTIRVSALDDPQSLDPRKIRSLADVTALHLINEGLTRINPQGELEMAHAETIVISPDKKSYTVRLREAYWSNGDPVTARDFIDTWLSMLDPEFPSPNAYQLYPIRNSKLVKNGNLPMSDVGLDFIDDQTFVIHLESPTPYFMELLATHFYFPVHRVTRDEGQTNKVANGPFMLDEWKRGQFLRVKKNHHYWDQAVVKLDGVELIPTDETTALQIFETDQLDWVGSPLASIPQNAILPLKERGDLLVTPGAGTHWFRFNTEAPPFDRKEIRHAFASALNREELIEQVTQGNQEPAMQVVPKSLGLNWRFDQTNFEKSSLKKEEVGTITICYKMDERNHKIAQAVQQQWQQAFGIPIKLQSLELGVYYDLLSSGKYQIALGSWYADIRDPINFLEIFSSRDNPTNQTGWEDRKYQLFLNLASREHDEEKRARYLMLAEKVLMDGMPVAPLFFNAFNYLKKESVQGVYFSELGYLDFKYASKVSD